MQNEKLSNTNFSTPIGKEIAFLRKLLDFTQEDLGKLMLISRVSVNKLEKIEKIDEVSNDIAYRIYYFTQQISEDPFKEDYVHNLASKINQEIKEIIEKRIKQ